MPYWLRYGKFSSNILSTNTTVLHVWRGSTHTLTKLSQEFRCKRALWIEKERYWQRKSWEQMYSFSYHSTNKSNETKLQETNFGSILRGQIQVLSLSVHYNNNNNHEYETEMYVVEYWKLEPQIHTYESIFDVRLPPLCWSRFGLYLYIFVHQQPRSPYLAIYPLACSYIWWNECVNIRTWNLIPKCATLTYWAHIFIEQI